MHLRLSNSSRKALEDSAEICSPIFIIGMTYVMLFVSPQFYSNPLFDRTTTHDHLLSYLAFLGLYCVSVYKLKVRRFSTSLALCLFVFGIGNMFADNLILGYHFQFTYDYVIPILSAVFLILESPNKLKMLELLGSIVSLIMIPYVIWVIFSVPHDWGGFPYHDFVWYERNGIYFWNIYVNLWTIAVWAYNFSAGYTIYFYSMHTNTHIGDELNLKHISFQGIKNKMNQTRKRGESMLEKIILLAIALFVLAFILPPALTAIATAALTSVNSAVVTLFQVLVPIIAIVVVVLLFYRGTKGNGT